MSTVYTLTEVELLANDDPRLVERATRSFADDHLHEFLRQLNKAMRSDDLDAMKLAAKEMINTYIGDVRNAAGKRAEKVGA